ncbi:MAG: hypothetical protein Q4C52_02805 [Eubacteriales bacterium]|nr:hypothetical protein [Eubacteriales bacterium]
MQSDREAACWRTYLQSGSRYAYKYKDIEEQVIRLAVKSAYQSKYILGQKWGKMSFMPEEILKSMNISLQYTDTDWITNLGEYDPCKKTVTLYRNNIARYEDYLLQNNKQKITLKSVCLYHELYHVLEDVCIGDTRKNIRNYLGKTILWKSKVLPFASEIAAHTFAMLVCDLSELPINLVMK